jgi:Kef-type K+ transport system membrane component KefB
MTGTNVIYSLFLVFTGAACLATVALYARQAMIVAYIVLGILLGPSVLGAVADSGWIKDVAAIGIMFLLFLIGLNLPPRQLRRILGEALTVCLLSSAAFVVLGFALGAGFGFSYTEALFIGAVLMFSSTIIGIKLLPTTALHHRHTGQIIVSVLLLQDLIAIVLLLLLQGFRQGGGVWLEVGLQLLMLPVLLGFTYLLDRFVLERLIARFDQIHEYVFLLAIGWCLGIAELAHVAGLSHEIGAFIAGVTLAQSPIALFIAESLKPVRDFFLILFFFSLGAGLDLRLAADVLVPAVTIAVATLAVKPWVFRGLLLRAGERKELSVEIGVRLGQMSEFALLMAVLAVDAGLIGTRSGDLVKVATVLSFALSSYLIVLRYPTPIAVSDRLRRD